MTKSNNNPSKLQSEAVKELRKQAVLWTTQCGWKINIDTLEEFLVDQIQKAYSEGREEVLNEKDIAEKFLYSNLPLDLSIGTEFEVGGRYEDWGFIVNYKGNKISEGGNLEQAINNAKIKLSIQSKEIK